MSDAPDTSRYHGVVRVCLFMLAIFASSGCDPSDCLDSTECPTGQICAYLNDSSECRTPCQLDVGSGMVVECPAGEQCVMKGSSCDTCEDILSICD
jgi:hypothetical protein